MSHLVFCTLALKNASSEDYKNAYADLEEIGLIRIQKSDKGLATVIPTTSAMGKFTGRRELKISLAGMIRYDGVYPLPAVAYPDPGAPA